MQILTQLRYYVRPCQGPRYLLSLLALLVQKYRNWHLTCTAQGALGGSGVQIVHNSLLMRFFNAVFFFADPDTYVHRSGRTGRAGRSGVAVTFYTPRELPALRQIERRIKTPMTQV